MEIDVAAFPAETTNTASSRCNGRVVLMSVCLAASISRIVVVINCATSIVVDFCDHPIDSGKMNRDIVELSK